MKNDKSNPKEEESRSEGAVEERVDSIEDHLTKIEEMLEELIRNDQKSKKSQQISSETNAVATIPIAIGIFVMSFAFTFIELLLPYLLFYAAGVLLVFSGLFSIMGTIYTLKKGILIETRFWWSYPYLKNVYHYDKFSFSGFIMSNFALILMALSAYFIFKAI